MYSVEKEGQLTLFPPGTHEHANLLVIPGSEKARMMTVTSGQKCYALYKPSSLGGLLVRMLLGTSHWDSTSCYLTWRVTDTPGKRLLFRLAPSMPDIDEKEYSLLPTPRASMTAKHLTPKTAEHRHLNLEVWMAKQLFPTPTASQDYKPIRKLAPSEKNGDHGTMLVGAIGEKFPDLIGQSLNPQFLEWLMGFPINWTELEHLETP